MCKEDYSGSFIPSVSSVAGDLMGGAVSLLMAGGPVVLGLMVVAAVVSFIVANAVLITAAVCVVGLGTLAVVQYLKRFMVVVRDEAVPARGKPSARVAITRAYPLPRNLAITAPRRALPAPAPAVHLHFHGVPAEDIAAIVSRQGSPARPALEKE